MSRPLLNWGQALPLMTLCGFQFAPSNPTARTRLGKRMSAKTGAGSAHSGSEGSSRLGYLWHWLRQRAGSAVQMLRSRPYLVAYELCHQNRDSRYDPEPDISRNSCVKRERPSTPLGLISSLPTRRGSWAGSEPRAFAGALFHASPVGTLPRASRFSTNGPSSGLGSAKEQNHPPFPPIVTSHRCAAA